MAASNMPQNNFDILTIDDTIRLAKNEILQKWEAKYQEISSTKGKFHYTFAKKPGRAVWSSELRKLTTDDKITLGRIRSGHTVTKERLYSWKQETTEQCDICQEKEDIEHLLYYCKKYDASRKNFAVLKTTKPLERIFEDGEEKELIQITGFIKENKIRV